MSDKETAASIRAAIHYDPETGTFTWKERLSNCIHIGDSAGSLHLNGYLTVCIRGRAYLLHRLAWVYMTGAWPVHEIDHINGDPSDNRFSNLRAASSSHNKMNARRRSDNKSGYKGVCWDKRARKWRADIRLNSKSKFLGFYETPLLAHGAYQVAASNLFGQFARMA